jgi:UDP-N-acetyl-D-glucosamine dehydrogenase
LDAYDITQGVKEFDCVAIVTDHSAFDLDAVLAEARLVVDTRNATARHACPQTCRVVRL